MTSFASSSSAILVAALCCLGCATAPRRLPPGPGAGAKVALWPPLLLAGRPGPTAELRDQLEQVLRGRGVPLVGREALEAFLAKHRVRYTGGVHGDVARAAAAELGIEAILISSIDAYYDGSVPAVAASLRLVSAEELPRVRWMDAAALTGQDAPGPFELNVLTEIDRVSERVFAELADSLVAHLSRRPPRGHCGPERRFRPSTLFVGGPFQRTQRYSVAVMPFVNDTPRRGAGELVAFEFVRGLTQLPNVDVIEPGAVREELLRYRIVVEGGVPLDTARVVLELARADVVVTGTVHTYRDALGELPEVGFSAHALDRANNEVAWQLSSHGAGDDGVFFFDAGRVSTSRELSCRMVGTALSELASRAARR